MIRLPGVYMPQHLPTGPSKPVTADDVALIFFFVFAIVSVLLIIMAHMKFDIEQTDEDDKRRRITYDQPAPWKPKTPGGKSLEPIDLMRWFQPDNPMIQSRVAVVEQEKVLEPERERVTV